MNTNLNTDLNPILRDPRTHGFKAGETYLAEGKAAAIEVISTPAGESECSLTIVVTPYGPPADADAEALAGAREAVESARQSPHPRARAAAEIAAANLECPPAGDLSEIDVELWVEDKSEDWDARGKQRLDSDGQTRFDSVPGGAVCWIEFLPASVPKPKEPLVPQVVLMPALPRGRLVAAGFKAPGPGRLETLRRFSPQEGLTIRFETGPRKGEERKRLWITIHTMKKDWNGATVQFQIGPLRGAVQLLPAGEGWQGTTELRLTPDKLEKLARFEPQFTVQPLQQ